jgi:beta-glucanase (GH16 family)
MEAKPSRRGCLVSTLIGASVLVVLFAAYGLLITPLRSVRTATAISTANPVTSSASPPAHGTPRVPRAPTAAAEAPEQALATPTRTADRLDPSGVAMPTGDLPGWKLHYSDDFPGSSLGPEWFTYDGQPSGDRGGYFSPSHVTVGGGILNIAGSRDPAKGNIYVTGGVSNRDTDSQTYGRYSVRFRMDLGRGLAYVLLLWPHSNQYPPEVDFAEDNGTDRKSIFSSVHPADNGKPTEHNTQGDFTQWHTADMEWTPGRIVVSLDGKPWAEFTGGVPSQAMDLALQSQGWYCGQGWEACPDSSTPPVVNLQVDWVVAYELAS